MRIPEIRLVSCCALLTAAALTLPAQQPRLGTIDFPTSAGAKAQAEFIAGVLYMHSFEYPSAAAAFKRAEALEPAFAMAYWGEAMTYTHPVWNEQDTAAARAALRRLATTRSARLAKAPTARERAYLEAVEVLYGDGPKATRDTAYSAAMAHVAATYSGDAEAQAFYALSLLGLNQGQRDVPTYMRAGAIAESLFVAHPQHPGAAHYVIHAFDDPIHAPLGLRAARAYSQIAPDAAHAQHMTSHIFLALGMWDETVHANEIATTATRDRSGSWARASCGHYGEWLQYGYLEQGRPGAAAQLLDECRQQAVARSAPGANESVILMRAVQIVDGGDWNGAAVHMRIDTAGGDALDRALLHFGTAYAASKRGDTATARAESAALTKLTMANSEDLGYIQICAREIDALVALQNGGSDRSLSALRRAVAIEDSLPVAFGPPLDVKPPRELLGEVLLGLGRAAEAQHELERQLGRTPRRASTLLALAHAAGAAGKPAVSESAYADLTRAWHGAEPNVAQILKGWRPGT
ncbi:MAG: hypothetical protein ACREN6_01430 [Gemmatimonadaceae bacterium]